MESVSVETRTQAPEKPEALFGAWLRSARHAAQLTLKELTARLGCSVAYWSDVECGRRGITRTMCEKLGAERGVLELQLPELEVHARAGHLPEWVWAYVRRQPKALELLALLARSDTPLDALLDVQRFVLVVLERRSGGPP